MYTVLFISSVISSTSTPLDTKTSVSLIRPIYKKGDNQLITNYRPISLLTSFSKIFEKLIFTRLYNHLCTNGILAKERYGFRSNTSAKNEAYNVIN
jgi:hypothetical protein